MYLQVASHLFHLVAELSLEMADPEGGYSHFFTGEMEDPSPEVIPVRILHGRPSLHPRMREVFNAGPSWSMFASGQHRCMALHGPQGGGHPLLTVEFTPAMEHVDVVLGRGWTTHGDSGPMIPNPFRYPVDQVLLMYLLSRRAGVIVHGCGAVCNGRGVVLAGPSGAGKSTIAKVLSMDPRWRILSDDRVVVQAQEGSQLHVYGTPWPGEAGFALNEGAPLWMLCFLSHGPENALRPLNGVDAFHRLMEVVSVPWFERELVEPALGFCESVINRVPAFEFLFRPEEAASWTLMEALSQGD